MYRNLPIKMKRKAREYGINIKGKSPGKVHNELKKHQEILEIKELTVDLDIDPSLDISYQMQRLIYEDDKWKKAYLIVYIP